MHHLVLKFFLFKLRELARKLASPFGHPTQVFTQDQFAATRALQGVF